MTGSHLGAWPLDIRNSVRSRSVPWSHPICLRLIWWEAQECGFIRRPVAPLGAVCWSAAAGGGAWAPSEPRAAQQALVSTGEACLGAEDVRDGGRDEGMGRSPSPPRVRARARLWSTSPSTCHCTGPFRKEVGRTHEPLLSRFTRPPQSPWEQSCPVGASGRLDGRKPGLSC